jgi:hypothetical protein
MRGRRGQDEHDGVSGVELRSRGIGERGSLLVCVLGWMRTLPSNTAGMTLFWMFVGDLNPISLHDCVIHCDRCR